MDNDIDVLSDSKKDLIKDIRENGEHVGHDEVETVDLSGWFYNLHAEETDETKVFSGLTTDVSKILVSIINECSTDLTRDGKAVIHFNEYDTGFSDFQFDGWTVNALKDAAGMRGFDLTVEFKHDSDVKLALTFNKRTLNYINNLVECDKANKFLAEELDVDAAVEKFKKKVNQLAKPVWMYPQFKNYDKYRENHRIEYTSSELIEKAVSETEAGIKKLLAYAFSYQAEALQMNGEIEILLGVHTNPFFVFTPSRIDQLKEIADSYGLDCEVKIKAKEDLFTVPCDCMEPVASVKFLIQQGELTTVADEEGDDISLV